MSEARHQRFEIDIEEIERQLRRTTEASPPARPDPLAELARIVGQDDPFRGILGDIAKTNPAAAAARPQADAYASDDADTHAHSDPIERVQASAPAPRPVAPPPAPATPEDTDMHPSGFPAEREPRSEFDPVVDAYGSADDALATDDYMEPLQTRRSRAPLFATAAGLVVMGGLMAGGLYWYRSGTSSVSSGTPPLITADRSPAKVAPENPGGIDVPNQNKQIYERNAKDGQSRVVDSREQPVDVREAARSLPPRSPADPVAGAARNPSVAAAPAAQPNAVTSALGAPRTVKTVTVRPDGSLYSPPGSIASSGSTIGAPSSLPAPVPVTTVSIPTRPPAVAGTGAPATAAPSSAAQPAANAPTNGATPAASPAPVTVLPPSRPKSLGRSTDATETARPAPTQTASLPAAATPSPAAAASAAAEKPAPAAAAGRSNFSVQIAVRPSEDEARSAYSSLQDKFASDLDGKPAQVNKAEVGGRTVYRVRVGPMSKDAANALCTRLKSSGGQCFVATGI